MLPVIIINVFSLGFLWSSLPSKEDEWRFSKGWISSNYLDAKRTQTLGLSIPTNIDTTRYLKVVVLFIIGNNRLRTEREGKDQAS